MKFRHPGIVLVKLLSASNVSQADVCRGTGLKSGTVSRISDQTEKSVSLNNVRRLAWYFGLTLGQMAGDEPLPDDLLGDEKNSVYELSGVQHLTFPHRICPIVEPRNVAVHLKGEDMNYEITLPCPVQCSNKTFCFEITNSAMDSDYKVGDVVFIDPDAPYSSGDDVLVELDGNYAVRRHEIEGDKIILTTANKSWPESVTPISDPSKIIGPVIFNGRFPRNRNTS